MTCGFGEKAYEAALRLGKAIWLGHLPDHRRPASASSREAQTMTEKTVDLDGRRGMEAQKATDLRRLLAEVEANERSLRLRQEEGAGSAPRRCPRGELGGSRRQGPLYPGPLCGNADRRRHAPANPGRGSAEGSGASRQRAAPFLSGPLAGEQPRHLDRAARSNRPAAHLALPTLQATSSAGQVQVAKGDANKWCTKLLRPRWSVIGLAARAAAAANGRPTLALASRRCFYPSNIDQGGGNDVSKQYRPRRRE
jgi:hypothetical protein